LDRSLRLLLIRLETEGSVGFFSPKKEKERKEAVQKPYYMEGITNSKYNIISLIKNGETYLIALSFFPV
jgi:hypothetical protein